MVYRIFLKGNGCAGSAQCLQRIQWYELLSFCTAQHAEFVLVVHLMSQRRRCVQTDGSRRMGPSTLCNMGPGDPCCERRVHGACHRSRQDIEAALEAGTV